MIIRRKMLVISEWWFFLRQLSYLLCSIFLTISIIVCYGIVVHTALYKKRTFPWPCPSYQAANSHVEDPGWHITHNYRSRAHDLRIATAFNECYSLTSIKCLTLPMVYLTLVH